MSESVSEFACEWVSEWASEWGWADIDNDGWLSNPLHIQNEGIAYIVAPSHRMLLLLNFVFNLFDALLDRDFKTHAAMSFNLGDR